MKYHDTDRGRRLVRGIVGETMSECLCGHPNFDICPRHGDKAERFSIQAERDELRSKLETANAEIRRLSGLQSKARDLMAEADVLKLQVSEIRNAWDSIRDWVGTEARSDKECIAEIQAGLDAMDRAVSEKRDSFPRSLPSTDGTLAADVLDKRFHDGKGVCGVWVVGAGECVAIPPCKVHGKGS